MELLSWHRVGQRVVCVNGWAWYEERFGPLRDTTPGPCIEHGGVYTISAVGQRSFPAFKLAGVPAEGWWPADRFRPVRDTSIESLRALLRPTPETRRQLKEMDT